MFRRHLLSATMAVSMVATATLPAHAYRKAGIPERGFIPQTSYMAERGRVSAPYAHIEFCVHSPSECIIRSANAKTARLNSASWRQLKQVNYKVNRSMRAKSDRSAHGKVDHWSIGGRVGDCEDYALTKRHELIRRGWSSNTLLVATARDRRNRSHAVLIAHTNRGDFVLDNLTGRIRAWNKTGYKWLKRQSRSNPKRWVRLNGRPAITGSIPAKSTKKSHKITKARKVSALAMLRKTRALKNAPSPNRKVGNRKKGIILSTMPPLPVRNVARQSQKRIAKLQARLKDVQKRLAALKKDENRIAQLLEKLGTDQKKLAAKNTVKTAKDVKIVNAEKAVKAEKTVKTAKSVAGVQKKLRKRSIAKKLASKRRLTKKTVTKRKSVRKSIQKRRTPKRASRKRTTTKALALLRKIRKARRHKSTRPYKRRWTQRSYLGSIFSI